MTLVKGRDGGNFAACWWSRFFGPDLVLYDRLLGSGTNIDDRLLGSGTNIAAGPGVSMSRRRSGHAFRVWLRPSCGIRPFGGGERTKRNRKHPLRHTAPCVHDFILSPIRCLPLTSAASGSTIFKILRSVQPSAAKKAAAAFTDDGGR